jgi:hypothetical protein
VLLLYQISLGGLHICFLNYWANIFIARFRVCTSNPLMKHMKAGSRWNFQSVNLVSIKWRNRPPISIAWCKFANASSTANQGSAAKCSNKHALDQNIWDRLNRICVLRVRAAAARSSGAFPPPDLSPCPHKVMHFGPCCCAGGDNKIKILPVVPQPPPLSLSLVLGARECGIELGSGWLSVPSNTYK